MHAARLLCEENKKFIRSRKFPRSADEFDRGLDACCMVFACGERSVQCLISPQLLPPISPLTLCPLLFSHTFSHLSPLGKKNYVALPNFVYFLSCFCKYKLVRYGIFCTNIHLNLVNEIQATCIFLNWDHVGAYCFMIISITGPLSQGLAVKYCRWRSE